MAYTWKVVREITSDYSIDWHLLCVDGVCVGEEDGYWCLGNVRAFVPGWPISADTPDDERKFETLQDAEAWLITEYERHVSKEDR